jgi:hypothetical protein
MSSAELLKLHRLKYRRDYSTYVETGSTYQLHVMLWHFALTHSQSTIQTNSFYRKLLRVKNLLMMSALELTHWVLNIEEQSSCRVKLSTLLFTGFACKQFYSSDLKSIEAKCEGLVPNFSTKFRQWAVMTDTAFPVALCVLNNKFNELKSSARVRRSQRQLHLAPAARKCSEISNKSDLSTEEDFESRMEIDMLHFEMDTMKGEKLSPIDDFFSLA